MPIQNETSQINNAIGCMISFIRHFRKGKTIETKTNQWRRSQDGGGVGRGEQFLPHKFIKRAFKRRVNSIKQLLNAGRGHQAPRKAAQLFERR